MGADVTGASYKVKWLGDIGAEVTGCVLSDSGGDGRASGTFFSQRERGAPDLRSQTTANRSHVHFQVHKRPSLSGCQLSSALIGHDRPQ